MNNIRRDEIDKIKRRRKRKSNKLLISTKPSKALIAFYRHIEAAQSDIEKSRLKYSNDASDSKKPKLTLGIFDNAVCSKNVKNILQHSVNNKKNNLFKLPIVNHKLEKEKIDKELTIEETLHELADKCREQLNIRYCSNRDEWMHNTPGMMRLRAAKADAYRNNRLELIDCGVKMGRSSHVGEIERVRVSAEPSIDNVIEVKPSHEEKQAQPSLSASTSISNCRISFLRPQPGGRTQRDTRMSNVVDSSCEPIHPFWDTPEELRTSHMGAFADCSFYRDTLSSSHDYLTDPESRVHGAGASLWMKD